MTEGDVALTSLPQADGRTRPRPAILLRQVPPFSDWLICGVSTQYEVALSIPNELLESGETLSKRLKVSRSRLYATALAEFLAKHRGRKITERLNAVYGSEDSRLPGALRRLQRRSLIRELW